MRKKTPTNPEESSSEKVSDIASEQGAGPDEESGGEAPAGSPDDPVTLSRGEYDDLLRKAREHALFLDELRRAKADFENYQKRVRRERPTWEAQAMRPFLRDVVGVVDDFERAMEATDAATVETLREGVGLIYRMVHQTLEAHHVEEIPALGQPFDPEFHEAVRQVPSERPEDDGVVLEVHQKGYAHRGAVLRPAKVGVGKAVAGPPAQGQPEGRNAEPS
jgi:molecular chaperone GrpE